MDPVDPDPEHCIGQYLEDQSNVAQNFLKRVEREGEAESESQGADSPPSLRLGPAKAASLHLKSKTPPPPPTGIDKRKCQKYKLYD